MKITIKGGMFTGGPSEFDGENMDLVINGGTFISMETSRNRPICGEPAALKLFMRNLENVCINGGSFYGAEQAIICYVNKDHPGITESNLSIPSWVMM